MSEFLLAWTGDVRPSSLRADLSSPQLLKLATEELKAFYLEAAAAQPGAIIRRQAADWFWGQTAAARLLLALRAVCLAAPEPNVRWIGQNLMVPRAEWSRFGIEDRWWRRPA